VFGTADVLALTGTGGTKDRFYVLALEDFSDDFYCWYYNADNMEDWETTTSLAFGTGKSNTATMIEKWNKEEYGDQNGHDTYKDMWGAIKTKVSQGWFVPSLGELMAVGRHFFDGEWSDDMEVFYHIGGLSDVWSSSQAGSGLAMFYRFDCTNEIWDYYVTTACRVRLSITF